MSCDNGKIQDLQRKIIELKTEKKENKWYLMILKSDFSVLQMKIA
jgi:hypothetical protein